VNLPTRSMARTPVPFPASVAVWGIAARDSCTKPVREGHPITALQRRASVGGGHENARRRSRRAVLDRGSGSALRGVVLGGRLVGRGGLGRSGLVGRRLVRRSGLARDGLAVVGRRSDVGVGGVA